MNKKTKHTSGKWQKHGACVKVDGWKIIASMGSANNAPDEEVTANQDLICSAPDLLEALESAVEVLEAHGYDCKAQHAAINKAKGNQ